ncbi:uncharacterized protein G2W53_000980 [Senna tora]|uniref:Uncharacterized protein n=1 Tax=Senna tora TaxID=362788 RepID=A0A834XEP8_9FABA|nr:uncharacterized protein G2W53_000980 [Senna tora]
MLEHFILFLLHRLQVFVCLLPLLASGEMFEKEIGESVKAIDRVIRFLHISKGTIDCNIDRNKVSKYVSMGLGWLVIFVDMERIHGVACRGCLRSTLGVLDGNPLLVGVDFPRVEFLDFLGGFFVHCHPLPIILSFWPGALGLFPSNLGYTFRLVHLSQNILYSLAESLVLTSLLVAGPTDDMFFVEWHLLWHHWSLRELPGNSSVSACCTVMSLDAARKDLGKWVDVVLGKATVDANNILVT